MNKRQRKKTRRKNNRLLCEGYPFLLPRKGWEERVPTDYKYDWTNLDDMPKGWRVNFADNMLSELRDDLVANDFLDEYRVLQIKEKYGELRWYSGGIVIGSAAHEITEKYRLKSRHVCIECGKEPVPIIDDGWIRPICKACYEKERSYKKKRAYEDVIIVDEDDNEVQQLPQTRPRI